MALTEKDKAKLAFKLGFEMGFKQKTAQHLDHISKEGLEKNAIAGFNDILGLASSGLGYGLAAAVGLPLLLGGGSALAKNLLLQDHINDPDILRKKILLSEYDRVRNKAKDSKKYRKSQKGKASSGDTTVSSKGLL